MTKGEIEVLIAEARERARHPYVWDAELLGRTISRLADALALTRGGGEEVENSNGLSQDIATTAGAVEGTKAFDPERALNRILDEAWQGLLEKDDRTSPVEYPEMVLITYDELKDTLSARALSVEEVYIDGGSSPSTANVEAGHDIPTKPVKTPPDTEHDGGEVLSRWLPIETAPRDGTPIIGLEATRYRQRITLCWWQPEFEGWISGARHMVMAEGYTIDGAPSKLHSPNLETPTDWLPFIPPPPRTGGE